MSARGTAATTRLRKAHCTCGYTIRVSRKWLEVGLPTCPCGETMTCPDAADALLATPDAFETLSDRARNAVMRELGYTDEIVRKAPPRKSRQRRCPHPSCSRFVSVEDTTCAAGHAQQWAVSRGLVTVSTTGNAVPF